MKSEVMRISHELQAQKEKIKENAEKIKVNKTLPYLVSNVIEVCVRLTPYEISIIFSSQMDFQILLLNFQWVPFATSSVEVDSRDVPVVFFFDFYHATMQSLVAI